MGISSGHWKVFMHSQKSAKSTDLETTHNSPGVFGLTLKILLLIAGVEPNPGPLDAIQCELCGTLYKTQLDAFEKREKDVSKREKSVAELEKRLHELNLRDSSVQEIPGPRANLYSPNEASCLQDSEDTQQQSIEPHNPQLEAHILPSAESMLKAAKIGSVLDVDRILSSGSVSVSCKDQDHKTALLLAAENGHLSVVRLLLEQFITEESARENERGLTAIHLAALNGHLQVVQYLIERETMNNAVLFSAFNETPLHLAAEGGHLHVIRFLVHERKLEVNARDFDGQTALYRAVRKGNLPVVHYLVSQGNASTVIPDINGTSCLFKAVEKGYIEVVRYLIQVTPASSNLSEEDKQTLLLMAAREGHLAVVRILIEKLRVDRNSRSSNRRQTALHCAVLGNHLDIVMYLVIEARADTKIRDRLGRVPVQHSQSAAIKAFLSRF